MTDPTELKIMRVYITGIHPYTFRCGKKAIVTGVKSISDPKYPARICYEMTFPDGFIDYVPLCDMRNYKLEVIP